MNIENIIKGGTREELKRTFKSQNVRGRLVHQVCNNLKRINLKNLGYMHMKEKGINNIKKMTILSFNNIILLGSTKTSSLMKDAMRREIR